MSHRHIIRLLSSPSSSSSSSSGCSSISSDPTSIDSNNSNSEDIALNSNQNIQSSVVPQIAQGIERRSSSRIADSSQTIQGAVIPQNVESLRPSESGPGSNLPQIVDRVERQSRSRIGHPTATSRRHSSVRAETAGRVEEPIIIISDSSCSRENSVEIVEEFRALNCSRRDNATSSSSDQSVEMKRKTSEKVKEQKRSSTNDTSLNTEKVKKRMSPRCGGSSSNRDEQIGKKVKVTGCTSSSSGKLISDNSQRNDDSIPSTSKQSAVQLQKVKKLKIRICSASGGSDSNSQIVKTQMSSRSSGSESNSGGQIAKRVKTQMGSSSKQSPVMSQISESTQNTIEEQIELVPQIADTVKTRRRKCNEKKVESTNKTVTKKKVRPRTKKQSKTYRNPMRERTMSLTDAVPVIAARKSRRMRRVSIDMEAGAANSNSGAANKEWIWPGKPYRKTGFKDGERQRYYKSIIRGDETISKNMYVTLTSKTSRPHVARIKEMWHVTPTERMFMNVNWFYFADETKKHPNLKYKRGLFKSKSTDVNDVTTIETRCEILSFKEYITKFGENPNENHEDYARTYYLAGSYNADLNVLRLKRDVPLV